MEESKHTEEEEEERHQKQEGEEEKHPQRGQEEHQEEKHQQEEATQAGMSPARFVQVEKLSGEANNARRAITREGLILPFGRTSKGSKSSSKR